MNPIKKGLLIAFTILFLLLAAILVYKFIIPLIQTGTAPELSLEALKQSEEFIAVDETPIIEEEISAEKTGYLASSDNDCYVYDLEFSEKSTLPRGTKVTYNENDFREYSDSC